MDWPDKFPYLVPVWHSLSNFHLKHRSRNVIDPNFDIEIGGIGTFNNIRFKNYKRLPYKIDRPILPFFMDTTNQKYSQFHGYNCLAYCPRKKILFSSKNKQLNCLELELPVHKNVDRPHIFAEDQKTSVNPFSYDILNISSQKVSGDYIIALKTYGNETNLEIMSQTRNSIDSFTYGDDEESSSKIQPKFSINSSSNLFPSNESLLDVWDRNSKFPEELLSTFINDDNIYHWNMETNALNIEHKLNVDVTNDKNRFVNIEFLKDLNPFLYIYGTHHNISLGDMRLNMSGSKSGPTKLVNADEFMHFKPFELFQGFVLNPAERHQFITTSDFNINFFDLRYPVKNLFQCKHMINDKMVNKLSAVCFQSSFSSHRSLLTLASNHLRTCLLSFDCELAVQPSMLHVPFYVESPHSINRWFPLFSEYRSFIRGMQIMVNENMHTENFFSVAFILNNGDIFLQDFRPVRPEIIENAGEIKVEDFNEFMYENHVGNKIYFHEEFDDAVEKYLENIKEYSDCLKSTTKLDACEYFAKKLGSCPSCKEELIKDLIEKDFPEKSEGEILSELFKDFLICSDNQANFCTCLNSDDLPEESDENDENILSTQGSLIVGDKVKFTDSDEIDFEYIKRNWLKLSENPNIGIRQFCRPLTRRLFDQWCGDAFSDEPESSESKINFEDLKNE